MFLGDKMNYGIKLKELRTSEILTQKDIANILNINRSTYKDYELQIKIIPIFHLNTLSNYFHVSLDYLFGLSVSKNYQNSNNLIDTKKQAERLLAFRKKYKLTQEQLASFLNTTHSVISDYEHGKKVISTPFLFSISSKYHISADYLLGKTKESEIN